MKLDWWPITRDSILYSINLLVLIWFSWDSRITLWESIVLVVMYFIYFVILFQNKRIINFGAGIFNRTERNKSRKSCGECLNFVTEPLNLECCCCRFHFICKYYTSLLIRISLTNSTTCLFTNQS